MCNFTVTSDREEAFKPEWIFASGIILYALVFGLAESKRLIAPRTLEILIALGVLIYAGTVVASLILGGNFLDYSALSHEKVHGQHLGILLVELGVGITVTAVLIAIFYAFAGREKNVMGFSGLFNYWIVILLMMTGPLHRHPRAAISSRRSSASTSSRFQSSYSTSRWARFREERPPILDASISSSQYSNPLPHVLILTAIVVGVATTSVGLALIVRIQESYGSIEEDEIQLQDIES